jgi:hypothetical protein
MYHAFAHGLTPICCCGKIVAFPLRPRPSLRYPLVYFVTVLCPLPLPAGPPGFLNSARVTLSVSHGPRAQSYLLAGSLLWFVLSWSRISLDDGRTLMWTPTRGLVGLVKPSWSLPNPAPGRFVSGGTHWVLIGRRY